MVASPASKVLPIHMTWTQSSLASSTAVARMMRNRAQPAHRPQVPKPPSRREEADPEFSQRCETPTHDSPRRESAQSAYSYFRDFFKVGCAH